MAEETTEIVSGEEMESDHADANFGYISKRDVVDEGVLKYAFGFSSGHTQLTILQEHGLVRQTRSYSSTLTKKGQKYLRAMYRGEPVIGKMMHLRT